MSERKDVIVGAMAALVLYIARLKVNHRLSVEGLKQSGSDAFTAGVIAFCLMIAWIAFEAAKLVLTEIAEDNLKNRVPQYLPILSPSGEQILASPQTEILYPHYRVKIWSLATLLILLMVGVSYVTWDKTNYERKPDDISQINDGDFLDVVTGWGVEAPPAGLTGGDGWEDIDTTRLQPFREKYELLLVARIHDTHLSAFKDSNIGRSNLFPIPGTPPNAMKITVALPSPFLASRLSAGGTGEMEFHLCLIPRTLDVSTIVNLDDITARGGHVFRPARGGGMSLASAGASNIPLAPPSPNAHSVINETFVGVIKDESHHNMMIRIYLAAASDVQFHADVHMEFMLGQKLIKTDASGIDFVSKDQIQVVQAGINFSPVDWSDFVSGSTPLSVRIPVDYKDQGTKTRFQITGDLSSNSTQLANLKTRRIKLP